MLPSAGTGLISGARATHWPRTRAQPTPQPALRVPEADTPNCPWRWPGPVLVLTDGRGLVSHVALIICSESSRRHQIRLSIAVPASILLFLLGGLSLANQFAESLHRWRVLSSSLPTLHIYLSVGFSHGTILLEDILSPHNCFPAPGLPSVPKLPIAGCADGPHTVS